jgi:hypothetical protein
MSETDASIDGLSLTTLQDRLLHYLIRLTRGRNNQVGSDATASWANSAGSGTQVNIDLVQPTNLRRKYRVQVHNPSTETSLTFSVRNRVTIGEAERLVEVAAFAVPANSGKEAIIEGLFGGDNGVRLVASNDTALGLTGAFTAHIAIREA